MIPIKKNILSLIKHPLLKSGLVYVLFDALNKAVPFLLLPIISHYLTPADYGIVANFTVFTSVVIILINFSIEGILGVNFFKVSKQTLASYIYNAVQLSFIASWVVLVLATLMSEHIYNSFKIPFSFIVWGVIMCFFGVFSSINTSLWRLEEKPFKFGVYQISQTLFGVCLTLFFVVFLQKQWQGRLEALIITAVLFGCISLIFLYKRDYLKKANNKSIKQAILAFGLPMIPHLLSGWLRSGIDRIYITFFYGESQTGLYAVGFQFGILVSFLMVAFNNAFIPYLFKKLSETDQVILQQNKLHIKKISYLIMLFLPVIAAVFYGISIIMLKYFFNKDYSQASIYILWAIIAQVFSGFYLLYVNYIFFVKKTRLLAMITFSCSLVQVILSYFCIKYLGAVGGAYVTALVSLINFIAVAFYAEKVYPMKWFGFNISKL